MHRPPVLSGVIPVLLLFGLFWVSTPTHAANPSSATLGPTNGASATWAGRGVAGATTDETTCVNGVDCDTFTLNLSGSPANYANLVVTINVGWKLGTNDYDVYVHKGDLTGPIVASSTDGIPGVSESVVINPSIMGVGLYTVHVVDSTVAPGDAYQATAAITTPAAAQDNVATGVAPTYANYQSPASIGNDSGEPSIGSHWSSGNIMFQAVFDTMRVSFNTSVSPATAAWQLKDGPNTDITTLDPILFTDASTGRTVVSQLFGTTSLSAFTDDDGETYTVSQGGGIASGIDHQTVGGRAVPTLYRCATACNACSLRAARS